MKIQGVKHTGVEMVEGKGVTREWRHTQVKMGGTQRGRGLRFLGQPVGCAPTLLHGSSVVAQVCAFVPKGKAIAEPGRAFSLKPLKLSNRDPGGDTLPKAAPEEKQGACGRAGCTMMAAGLVGMQQASRSSDGVNSITDPRSEHA